MSREPHIPLFLWIATAIVAHALWGGGAHKAAVVLEETLNISAFAREVQRHVRLNSVPVEVSLLDETEEPSLEMTETPTEPESAEESDSDDFVPEELDPEKKLEKEKEEEKKKEEEKAAEEKKEEEKKKDAADSPEPVQIKVPNRIAVEQHVEDENQEDNPDANHIAEHANRVEQETRARITSTDQDAAQPSPGEQFDGPDPEPGNSDESRVAQSDDAPGDPARAPGAAASEPSQAATPPAQAAAPPAGGGQKAPQAPRPAQPREALPEQHDVPHVHDHGSGRWSMARPLDPQPPQKALPRRQAQKPTDLLGLGAQGTTKNGVNLNLTPQMAVAAVGADQLSRERQLDGERRRSAHRGSWKSLGIERWKPALENYVASVQPGNQTALNTARVPFARYLNHIHLRLHPIFADHFLSSLNALPKDHPLNRNEMSTHLELVLSKEDGRIVRMGITKSSGVTAFDVGALDSVQRASPFGPPPDAIVSPDGNVYLHWEFHRQPQFACSTYFARPFLLKKAPDTAPPRVAPPRGTPDEQPPYAPNARPGERSGFLDRPQRQSPQPSG